MTSSQWKGLTPVERRIRIAELCGASWRQVVESMTLLDLNPDHEDKGIVWRRAICFKNERDEWPPLSMSVYSEEEKKVPLSKYPVYKTVPDYENDLDAMHLAEELVPADKRMEYLHNLYEAGAEYGGKRKYCVECSRDITKCIE